MDALEQDIILLDGQELLMVLEQFMEMRQLLRIFRLLILVLLLYMLSGKEIVIQ